MTYQINTSNDTITVGFGEESITLPLDKATDFVMNVIEARKAGYAAKRDAGKAVREAKKAEREAKTALKQKAAAKRKADRVARLKKQLADAEKAAKKAA